MREKLSNLFRLIAISLIPTILIWILFFFRVKSFWKIPLPTDGMATIVANYDGPLYLVVAKTLYQKSLVGNFSFTLPAEYYAAHFPLFPLAIRAVAPLLGFPYSMLFITLISSILAIYFFNKFISDYIDKKNLLWLTFAFALFPARWLAVRSVGSAEPLFIAAIIASVYYFKQEKYLSSGIWGAIATLTKSPGILLFIAYFLTIFVPYFTQSVTKDVSKNQNFNLLRYTPLLVIPAALLAVFGFYKIQMNDFFAYFHSGDNIHLFFPPFQIFNYSAPWVGTYWLEEIIFVYLISFLGLSRLINKKDKVVSWVTGVFLVTLLFVSHRDLVRYSLPIIPFLFAGFSDYLVKKEFKYAMVLIIIPIFLYSLAFISNNVMPISDWAPLL